MFSTLNTSGGALVRAGVIESGGGKVRLLRRDELPADWNPDTDKDTNAWERAQHLVRAVLEGEEKAARLVKKIGADDSEEARRLAFLLYQVCDRRNWPEEAFAYNALSQSWERVIELSRHDLDGALF
jgi:putative DNA methylase